MLKKSCGGLRAPNLAYTVTKVQSANPPCFDFVAAMHYINQQATDKVDAEVGATTSPSDRVFDHEPQALTGVSAAPI